MKYKTTSITSDTSDQTRLGEVCDIRSGHLFRKGMTDIKKGNVTLIQSSDLNESGIIDRDDLITVDSTEIKEKSILGDRDVILKSKTTKPRAYVIDTGKNPVAVPSHFFIITPRTDRLKPKYLAWYLNSKIIRKDFNELLSGTNVPFLKKSDLNELIICIPATSIQEKIIKIEELMNTEKRINRDLIEKKEAMLEQIMINRINTSEDTGGERNE